MQDRWKQLSVLIAFICIQGDLLNIKALSWTEAVANYYFFSTAYNIRDSLIAAFNDYTINICLLPCR